MIIKIRFSTSDFCPSLSKTKLRSAFLFMIFLLFLLPISISGSSRGGLPIDLVISDLFSFILAFVYLFSFAPYSKREPLVPIQVLFVLFGFVLASFSAIHNADLLPIFSFVKFSKVILAFFAGYALSRWFGRDAVLRSLSNAAAAYLFLLFVSQFVYHRNFTPRLGSEVFEFSVYGFPNSPSSYLVFVLCVALLKSRSTIMKWSLLLVAAIFAVGSLSRSALILVSLAIVALSFEKATWRQSLILIAVIGVGAFQFLPDLTMLIDIAEGVTKRLNRAQQTGDFSNGRFEIFRNSLYLIAGKPVFGYGFVSFSNFATHGTPHNQYLEVWFKLGVVGLLWYLFIIAFGASRILKTRAFLPDDLSLKGIYVMLVLVLVGNLAQPNLSYSPTGNLVFLIFGVFAIVPGRVSIHKRNPRSLQKDIPKFD